jgi:hypothetical protein
MPTTYTPSTTGALTLSYQQVSDGDKRKAASINPGLSTMSDDIAKLAAGKIASATLERTYYHFEYGIGSGQVIHWVKNHSSTPIAIPTWKQVAVATAAVTNDDALYLPFDPPHGATLSAFFFWFKVPVGPHGALPSVMPRVVLTKTDLTTGTVTTISSLSDPSATVGAYETLHNISAFGGTEVIDRTKYRYDFTFFGEYDGGGANGLDGIVALGAQVIYSPLTAVDQGAG